MRRFAHVDANQKEITAALRKAGMSVQPLSTVGKGCPDLLVGWNGRNWLLEVKNPKNPNIKQKFTPAEMDWHALWRGQVDVVHTIEEALAVIADPPSVTQYMSVPKDSDLPF
jgi:hypothetical protein